MKNKKIVYMIRLDNLVLSAVLLFGIILHFFF
jgi:hypothetical protein